MKIHGIRLSSIRVLSHRTMCGKLLTTTVKRSGDLREVDCRTCRKYIDKEIMT